MSKQACITFIARPPVWYPEVIALGFRAGVQTVSQSTTDRCGYGDYYEFKLPDLDGDDYGMTGMTGMTDPPLPPGCCSPKAWCMFSLFSFSSAILDSWWPQGLVQAAKAIQPRQTALHVWRGVLRLRLWLHVLYLPMHDQRVHVQRQWAGGVRAPLYWLLQLII